MSAASVGEKFMSPVLGIWDGVFSGDPEAEEIARQRKLAEQAQQDAVWTLDDQQRVVEQYARESPREVQFRNERAEALQGDTVAWDALARPASEYEQILDGRGLTDADRARMRLADTQMNQQLRGQREATQQNMAERGMAGSGSELAALLSGQQAASQGRAIEQANMNIAAQQRHDQAISGLAGVKGAQAQAQDTINQFNTQYRQDVQNRNVDRANQGALYNTEAANQHRREAVNAQQRAAESEANARMGFGINAQGQENTLYGRREAEKDRNAQKQGGILGGLLGGILSDERAKHVFGSADEAVDDILEALRPVLFSYRDPANGNGVHAGILAQDAQQTALGAELVVETPAGLALDERKLLSLTLAALARLHRRVSELEGRR